MDSSGAAGLVIILVIVAIYFLPCIIANNRNHNNSPAIFILNLFLGWTFLGWVVALVWSFTDNVAKPADVPIYDETGEARREPKFKE